MTARRQPDRRARYQVAPGTVRRRWRRKVHWELVSCGFGGHVLVGTDAAEVTAADADLVREAEGLRWHRCLRCDTWSALVPPDPPKRERVPSRDEIKLPMRGRPLRNRVVLRIIVVEKSLHVLVFAALATAVFLFTAHRRTIKGPAQRVLSNLGVDLNARQGLWHDVDRLFTVPGWELVGVGVLLAAYAAVLCAEIIGLWRARRWAEYLTFAETLLLVPVEVREVLDGVTTFRAASLAVNLAIILYLCVAHRLFGIRGGAAGVEAAERHDSGWPAVERATPPSPVPRAPVAAAGPDPTMALTATSSHAGDVPTLAGPPPAR